ncbi:hypothetical protein ACFLV4_01825 [Chloroflexota bacterium]
MLVSIVSYDSEGGEVTHRHCDSICCRVDNAAIEHDPFTTIPEGDNQVLFVNPFRYIIRGIGKSQSYWRVKGSSVRAKVISKTNDSGIRRWCRRVIIAWGLSGKFIFEVCFMWLSYAIAVFVISAIMARKRLFSGE